MGFWGYIYLPGFGVLVSYQHEVVVVFYHPSLGILFWALDVDDESIAGVEGLRNAFTVLRNL